MTEGEAESVLIVGYSHLGNRNEMNFYCFIISGDIGTCDNEQHYTIVDTVKTLIKYKGCQVRYFAYFFMFH